MKMYHNKVYLLKRYMHWFANYLPGEIWRFPTPSLVEQFIMRIKICINEVDDHEW